MINDRWSWMQACWHTNKCRIMAWLRAKLISLQAFCCRYQHVSAVQRLPITQAMALPKDPEISTRHWGRQLNHVLENHQFGFSKFKLILTILRAFLQLDAVAWVVISSAWCLLPGVRFAVVKSMPHQQNTAELRPFAGSWKSLWRPTPPCSSGSCPAFCVILGSRFDRCWLILNVKARNIDCTDWLEHG